MKLVSVSHGPPSGDSTAHHARHANQGPQGKLHKSRKSPPSHAVSGSVAPDDDAGGGGAAWIQEARNTSWGRRSFSVAGGCVAVCQSAKRGTAAQGSFEFFSVWRRRPGRTRLRPVPQASTANRILYLAKCRGTRSHPGNRACWTRAPVISRRNRWQATQTVLHGFWLPSGRQSNRGQPFAGLTRWFLWAACPRPKKRGLVVGRSATFLAPADDWGGGGKSSGTPVGTSATHTPRPRGANPLWDSAGGTFSIRRRARRLGVLGIQSRNLRPRSGNPGRPPGRTHQSWASHPIPSPIPLEARAAHPPRSDTGFVGKVFSPLEHCLPATITTSDLGILDVSSLSFILHLLCQRVPRPTPSLTRAFLYFTTGTSAASVPLSARFLDPGLDHGSPRLQRDSGPALTCSLAPSLLYASIPKPLDPYRRKFPPLKQNASPNHSRRSPPAASGRRRGVVDVYFNKHRDAHQDAHSATCRRDPGLLQQHCHSHDPDSDDF